MTQAAEIDLQQNETEQEHALALLAVDDCDWSEDEEEPAPYSVAILGYN